MEPVDLEGNRAILHRAPAAHSALALTHGAGSNLDAPLLVRFAEALCERGFHTLRYNLAYRRDRPTGPPLGANTKNRDTVGIAARWLTDDFSLPVYAGGHSYGGRMSTEYAAANTGTLHGLLLFSYPLHPPRKREELRTGHFPSLTTPAFFVHGERDPFGLADEMENAVKLLPGPVHLEIVSRAGHDLRTVDVPVVTDRFAAWIKALGVIADASSGRG